MKTIRFYKFINNKKTYFGWKKVQSSIWNEVETWLTSHNEHFVEFSGEKFKNKLFRHQYREREISFVKDVIFNKVKLRKWK